jgi:pilus assembly protein CpaB
MKIKLNTKFLKNKYVLSTLCMILSAIIAFIIVPNKEKHKYDTIKIVRTNQTIEANTLINESMLKTIEVMPLNLPDDIITDINTIIGKYTTVPLLPSDNLVSNKFADTSSLTKALFKNEDGKLAVSVSIKNLAASVSGKLLPGDVVSVYTYNTEDKSLIEYEDLKHVEILAITNDKGDDLNSDISSNNEDNNDNIPATITLSVNQNQAKELIKAENSGNIHIVFAGRGEYGKKLLNP